MADPNPKIPFIDLAAQRARIGGAIDAALARVMEHGLFIMGPEVRDLEQRLADYCGVRHAVTCGNGTDALLLLLMARGVGRGDAVFLPAFTFTATAEVVALIGATPVFVDVDPTTFNMDTASLANAIAHHGAKLRPAAVIAVDLFGQPADYTEINRIAVEHGLFVIGDAAQSFGASLNNRRVGQLCHATATSFFPAKPLGCCGDGGAIMTDDDELADVCRSLRLHGKGGHKYDILRIGMNSRLDTLQAAILIEKLAIFDDEITTRNEAAERYTALLGEHVRTPVLAHGRTSVWAQYTVQVEGRDELAAAMKRAGVPTAVYYPNSLNRQTAYQEFPVAPGGVPNAEALSQRVLSLPMHPYLDEPTQQRIADALLGALTTDATG